MSMSSFADTRNFPISWFRPFSLLHLQEALFPINTPTVPSELAIGSDHAGFRLKSHLIDTLKAGDHDVTDLGTDSEEPVDYPIYCSRVGRAVADGDADRGIVLGGSGQGEQLSAVGFAQVKMQLDAGIAVARRARVHEEQRISLPHRIGLLHGMKQLAAVGELRFEFLFQLLAHLVTTRADCWADIRGP